MSAVFPLGPAVRAALPCCVCWINKFVGHTKTFRFNFFSCNILPTYMRRGSGVKGATSCQLLSSLHPFKRKFSMRVRNLYLKLRYTIYSMNRLLVYLQGGTISNAISLTFCLCLCQCAENTRISQQSEMLFGVECTQLGRIFCLSYWWFH